MDLTYVYTIPRSAMGRQPLFCEQGPEMCDSMHLDTQLTRHYILRNPVSRHTQNTTNFSSCDINTVRADYVNSGINHSEGGWPRDVNIADPEATQRYRRKLEKDEGYIRCIMNLSPGLEHYVFQNNAIDMYQTYYSELEQLPKLEHSDCRTVNVFRDKPTSGARRPVSSISWQPEGGLQFAVTYVDVDWSRVPQSSINAHIWDVENASSPVSTIVPPCPLLDLQFNPRGQDFLAGGLMSGQVAVWDRRCPRAAAALCPPHVAHRDLVRAVLYVNAKSGMEFFSASADGTIKWWDTRNMDEPTDELIVDLIKSPTQDQSMATAYGVCVLEFENTIPTRFMVGTENGMVITGNRKGKTAMEKLPGKFDAHYGPVWALQRNPGFLKNFLTVGDWTARVWSEDCRESAIMWTPPERHRVTDATWSPTRSSLLMMTKWNGLLSMWDLLQCQHAPVLSVQVCDDPLVNVRAHEAGALLACGSAAGEVFLLELSRNLVPSDKNDKLQLTHVLERESKRERILEARMREIRLKQRQAEEDSAEGSAAELDAALGDSDLAQVSAEYFSIVKKELAIAHHL